MLPEVKDANAHPLNIKQHVCTPLCRVAGCFGKELIKTGWIDKQPTLQ